MELYNPKTEEKILDFWKKNGIFEKLVKKNKGKKRWSFLDGPITANNPMGVHHAWGRTYKDLFQRYKAMRGFDQRFQNGFDAQGLWVEVEVEKELGFKSKKDIEKYGIAKFVEKCKERVKKYAEIQTNQSIRLGQWMDWDHSYYTMSDDNNYAIWHFLKKCHEKKLLYKGLDVVPWCWRCGTAISQHEILTDDYKEVSHRSIFIKYPVRNKKNTYLLAWTTTPWTLPGNVAIAVDPKKNYVEAVSEVGNDVYYLIEGAVEKLKLKIIRSFNGKELVGLNYDSPFDHLPTIKKTLFGYIHKVIATDPRILNVEETEGTGLIHIAPGQGVEDYRLGKKEKLPIIDLIDDEAVYLDGLGEFSEKNAKEHPEIIIDYLETSGALFSAPQYKHRYPACWRCKTELVWKIADEWYLSMDKLRKPLIEAAKKIKWIPSFGLEREIDWLKNMSDWLISKKRYWGLALPIFECGCGSFEVIGSKEELKKRAIEGWEKFDSPAGGHSPHRPWVDEVKIKCPKCGEKVSRISDVGNPWLDAGITPYSTMGYFENKKFWRQWFPAELICESFPGQFKNWFYSLIVMSVVLEKVPPMKTVFGYASVRDEKGEEMHKSKGNAVWFDDATGKIGVEVMRWMYSKQNPADNLKFGYGTAKESERKLMNLWNSFTFFKTYSSKIMTKKSADSLLDKWILSRLNSLIETVAKNMDKYNTAFAARAIEEFFITDLSLWYIRRSRGRFQKPKTEKEKSAAIETLYFVLLNLSKIISPFLPFLAEEIYLFLKTKTMPESVHLCDWPKSDKKLINLKLEEQMNFVREISAKGLALRAEAGIKVRQPLASLKILSSKFKILKNKELLGLIKDEINVKEIIFGDKFELDTKITAELKEEGDIRELTRVIQGMRKDGGLMAGDIIEVYFKVENSVLEHALEKWQKHLLNNIGAKKIELVGAVKEGLLVDRHFKIGGQDVWIGIQKLKTKN
ncbi:MAG: isoleucine--tRNA ligase [Candidatus Azambacteria bacterium]|nr:isoleucine--tRNA ligase [Candidatus Azambacteria bacterium]